MSVGAGETRLTMQDRAITHRAGLLSSCPLLAYFLNPQCRQRLENRFAYNPRKSKSLPQRGHTNVPSTTAATRVATGQRPIRAGPVSAPVASQTHPQLHLAHTKPRMTRATGNPRNVPSKAPRRHRYERHARRYDGSSSRSSAIVASAFSPDSVALVTGTWCLYIM